jgi:light-regulated signal transduction histidine kinase (bacteriophytochrome)
MKNDTTSWTQGLYDIFEMEPENPEGGISYNWYLNHIVEEDRERYNAAIESCVKNKPNFELDYTIITANGKEKIVSTKANLVLDNNQEPIRLVGNTRDISAYKKVQNELQRNLRELNRSNLELEEFAYAASHDLQEPLRKIQAFGDMLKAKMPADTTVEISDLINRMQSASTRMKTLIDSLLSFSRLSFTQDQHQLMNLSVQLEAVLSDLETSIKEKNAVIHCGKLFPVKGEPMHLRQLFQNLIGNALKFAKEGEPPVIDISARLVRGGESGLQVSSEDREKLFQLIEIRDNGIGFESEYSNKIFQLFQRLHGKTEYPGSGVGLSIVQKVINIHNGYIRAESSLGQGACFQVLLPFDS